VQTNAAEAKASPENNAPIPARPPINWFYRYKEDWSVLADPALRTDHTAGHGSHYSGSYTQIRLDWAISTHLTGALDVEHFVQSRSLHEAGAHDGNFIALELKFGI
jgi:hypothetical protein